MVLLKETCHVNSALQDRLHDGLVLLVYQRLSSLRGRMIKFPFSEREVELAYLTLLVAPNKMVVHWSFHISPFGFLLAKSPENAVYASLWF